MQNILVCDDEKDIVSALKIYLSSQGYHIYEAYTGMEALSVLAEQEIQLVLLDVMMPRMDGITALSRIREQYNVPVILITAKSEDTDIILGLNMGADDYITKPFNPMEVIARVKSQLRRYLALGSATPASYRYESGGLCLDDRAKTVTLDGELIALTKTEYDILKLFLQNPGVVLSPKQIYEKVWNACINGSENTVAVHIRHLREKIEITPSSPRYLKVVWGQGYKLEGSKVV